MALDPNELLQSEASRQAQRQNAIKNYARNKITSSIKKKGRKVTMRAAGKAAKVILHYGYKVLIKGLFTLLGGLFSVHALAFFGIFLAIIITVIAFTSLNFGLSKDFNIDEINSEILAVFEEVSWETVDRGRPEQAEWRVPTGIISALVIMYQYKSELTNGANTAFYRKLGREVVNGLESQFTYKDIELLSRSYSVSVCEVCDEEGNCTSETSRSSTREFVGQTVSVIEQVDSWRGNYYLSYEKEWGDWYVADSYSSGSCSVTVYQMDQHVYESRRDYVENFDRLIAKGHDLGLSVLDMRFMDALFSETVDPNSPMYTQRTDIDLRLYLGVVDDEGIRDGGTIPGDSLPPDMLGGDYIWPTPGYYRITSPFGYRIHPVYGTPQGHGGIDIGAPGGANIYAVADGTVIATGPASGFGQWIVIRHANNIYTVYGHVQWNAYGVSPGDKVKQGDYIGQVGHGRVGTSTGPHLHLEFRVGSMDKKARKDPLLFLRPPK